MAKESKARVAQYKYTVSMAYLDQVNGETYNIKNECVKYIIIDHNYDVNSMPIMYASLKLDKKLIDDMILNCNTNLMMVAINKYDDLTDDKQEIECIRKKFTYFLPNDVNKNDPIDYNEETEGEHSGNTFRDISIGLMDIEHINNNKKSFNFLLKDTTIGKAVDKVIDHLGNDIVMESIGDDTNIEQLMMPSKNSVRKSLEYLNNIRVFYNTPYRFYQDYNDTYLISSSGKAIEKSSDTYTSVIIDIGDITERRVNDAGVIIDKDAETFKIPVNYINTTVWDNTIVNKSQTDLIGMSSAGQSKASLKNKADYSKKKNNTLRLYNDNSGMLNNIKASRDNSNFIVFIQKTDLDTDILSINKRITIHHIDRYKEHDGTYLMYRKREMYLREDGSFILNTMVHLREIQK